MTGVSKAQMEFLKDVPTVAQLNVPSPLYPRFLDIYTVTIMNANAMSNPGKSPARSMQDKPVLGILLGDPAGVGPEIVAKLAVADFFSAYCRPLFIGDKRILDRAFSVIGKKVAVKVVSSADKAEWNGSIPMLDLADADPEVCPYGKLSVVGGKACLDELTMIWKTPKWLLLM